MAAEGSVDVIARVGGTVERIETFSALRGSPEEAVTIAFGLEKASTVSLTFEAGAFLAFVARLQRFAHRLSGRPS